MSSTYERSRRFLRTRATRMAVEALLSNGGVRQAVAYVAPDFVVKATRQRKPTKRTRSETLLLTIGRPAYLERRFIKACLKAGEPFPVKKVQLKFYKERRLDSRRPSGISPLT